MTTPDDPNKLPDGAPGLPTMDTSNAEGGTFRAALVSHFRTHTLAYVTALALFLSANLQAVYENFGTLPPSEVQGMGWWQVFALGCKSLNAGFIALVAYLMKSPLPPKQEGTP